MDKKIWLGIGILVVVAGGWYFSSGNGLKGSFYEEGSGRSARNTEYTERRNPSEMANEIAENDAGSVSAAPSSYVGHYYFTNKDTTIGEIYQAIGEKVPAPSGGGFQAKELGYFAQKIIYYDKGYFIYPVNIFASGKVALSEQKIPKNRGVVLYNEISAISISDNPILRPPTAKPSNATTSAPLADNESGWILMASKEAKLSDFVAPFKDRVISAYALTNGDKFEKVDVNSYVFGKYSLVWIRLGVKGAPLTPNLGKELPPQSIGGVDTFGEMEEIDFGTETLPPLNEGAFVLGKWKNGYQWYRGTLGAVSSNGADINYNDGDKEQAVGWDKIADFDSHPESVKIGQTVVVFSEASGAYWSGKVKTMNGDQITVTFDDDGKNKTVSIKKDLWVPLK